ncbi:MAG: PEP/pyruvate-binding domain-containing protein [Thermodesulfobacteriota bacterium]|nr:PEP/pyruvate-binding domain-containing protein [Thermodesulfobacteriota bacterium]
MKPKDINIFHELMRFRVQEILLVSSPYDAFIMEEDISLTSRIIREYRGLNLSSPPRINRVTSARAALQLLEQKRYDLVMTMPQVGEMDGYTLGLEIKKIHSDLPVILLAHNVKAVYPPPQGANIQGIDNVFVWSIDPDLLLSIVKSVEDSMNAENDTATSHVRVLILIDDSPLYRSYFLPLIYREVVRQTQAVLDESLNEEHRLLKVRARPKILVAEDYEEALDLYEKFKPYVIGVISDVRFPRKCEMCDEAGFDLLQQIRNEVPDLPLLMLSSDTLNRERAEAIPAVFLDKNSPQLLNEIHHFFLRHLGFGEFVFRLPDGREVGRAANFHGLEKRLVEVPEQSLFFHAERNHFYNWIMARSEVDLALQMRNICVKDLQDGTRLRQRLIDNIHEMRKSRQRGVVARFDVYDFDSSVMDFVKIGDGSLGGKARGLAFMLNRLWEAPQLQDSGIKIRFPQTLVITSDGFEAFVEENSLDVSFVENDEVIARSFLQGRMPGWLEQDLAAFLAQVKTPLSVRSSSLLEDAQYKPYAGLYKTYMIPNNHVDFQVRLEQLLHAVKLVYASTCFAGPRAYSRRGQEARKDSMAVLVQQLVGRQYGDYFYPAISGVAQSYNFYPVSYMKPEEGIVHVALGFGKTVVEGEKSLRFSPSYPRIMPHFSTVEDILKNAQRYFYALKIGDPDHFSFHEGSNLEKREISEAEEDAPVRNLTSTFIPEEQRIRDGSFPGPKVLTFASILKYNHPLPGMLEKLLEVGRKGMGCGVEIEFAVDMADDPEKCEFYFLQIRPMVEGSERFEVLIGEDEINRSFCSSGQALGHGSVEDIFDLVYVRPDVFDLTETKSIAAEISRLNGKLSQENRPYLMIGPGRWGSADRWLGIPVQWLDISGVGAIIELRNEQLQVDASQGTHFFHNITSLNIPYFTVTEGEDRFDWDWLNALPVHEETTFLCHARLKESLLIKVDGRSSRGVILKGQRGKV